MRENERKQIHSALNCERGRAFARLTVTLAHSFQEDRFIAPEMN
jgi:hypothetical protein